jgi:hypothetical protein
MKIALCMCFLRSVCFSLNVEEKNIFGLIKKSCIPIEAKILACLRMLGRDACADENFP